METLAEATFKDKKKPIIPITLCQKSTLCVLLQPNHLEKEKKIKGSIETKRGTESEP